MAPFSQDASQSSPHIPVHFSQRLACATTGALNSAAVGLGDRFPCLPAKVSALPLRPHPHGVPAPTPRVMFWWRCSPTSLRRLTSPVSIRLVRSLPAAIGFTCVAHWHARLGLLSTAALLLRSCLRLLQFSCLSVDRSFTFFLCLCPGALDGAPPRAMRQYSPKPVA